MADRAATAAAVKNIIRQIQQLELENLQRSDMEAVRRATGLKEQEVEFEEILSGVK